MKPAFLMHMKVIYFSLYIFNHSFYVYLLYKALSSNDSDIIPAFKFLII